MTPIDSTKNQHAMLRSYVRQHVYINEKNRYRRKNFKLPYLHCYTANVTKIWRVET